MSNLCEKYRKKPILIDAWLFDGTYTCGCQIMQEINNYHVSWLPGREIDLLGALHINTLEGIMRADAGDYIIRGVKNEIYPCKPDIFAMTYEPV